MSHSRAQEACSVSLPVYLNQRIIARLDITVLPGLAHPHLQTVLQGTSARLDFTVQQVSKFFLSVWRSHSHETNNSRIPLNPNKPEGVLFSSFLRCPILSKPGSSYPLRCVLGTYSPNSANEKLEDCIPCDWGQYCGTFNLTAPSGKGKRTYSKTGTIHFNITS